MTYFNLIATVAWLAVGAILMSLQKTDPQNPGYYIPGTGISLAWVAILLALYNFARWFGVRSAAQRKALEASSQPVPRPPQPEPRAGDLYSDPNFDFNKPSPPAPGERPDLPH